MSHGCCGFGGRIADVGFLVRVFVNALALGVAAWLIDGIEVLGTGTGQQAVALIVVGFIFGLVNAIVAPIVKLLSLPFIILTLGLLLLVINACMLLLTSAIANAMDVGFHVDGLWDAILGSIVISVVSTILGAVLRD
jgi:putative membrane protein